MQYTWNLTDICSCGIIHTNSHIWNTSTHMHGFPQASKLIQIGQSCRLMWLDQCYAMRLATCQPVLQAWRVWPWKQGTILSVIPCFEPHQRTLNQPIAPTTGACMVWQLYSYSANCIMTFNITSWTVMYEQLIYITSLLFLWDHVQ